MKKLIAGLFAAILTTAGLVAVSSTSASAACTRYVCNNTQAVKPKPQNIRAGQKPKKVRVAVRVRGGNIAARGVVTVTITGPRGFRKSTRVRYTGKPRAVNMPRLKRVGNYRVVIAFKGNEGFRDSRTVTVIKVRAKRR